jgi:hypothetical protein
VRLWLLVVLVSVTAACGGGHRLDAASVARANQICERDDPTILAAENPPAYFTAATVGMIDNEAAALSRLRIAPSLRQAFDDWNQARSTLLTAPDIRTADGFLIKAQQVAARIGVRCSFGAIASPSRLP